MEIADSAQSLAPVCRSTMCHIPEDSNIHFVFLFLYTGAKTTGCECANRKWMSPSTTTAHTWAAHFYFHEF